MFSHHCSCRIIINADEQQSLRKQQWKVSLGPSVEFPSSHTNTPKVNQFFFFFRGTATRLTRQPISGTLRWSGALPKMADYWACNNMVNYALQRWQKCRHKHTTASNRHSGQKVCFFGCSKAEQKGKTEPQLPSANKCPSSFALRSFKWIR